ncbi:MAG: polysaccharide deacetylase family protein [bacterium]
MKKIKLIVVSILIGVFALSVLKPLVNLTNTQALAAETGPAALITITFDDGNKTIWDNALPIMSSHNMKGVFFGETGPLNSGEDWVMTWDQVRALQNTYGWEIGSHSVSHPYLTQVSDAQLDQELRVSKQDFAAHGINVKGFATPYGDYNTKVLSAIAQYYDYHRAAWGGANSWPYNKYEILAQEVSNLTTPSQVREWIASAVANKQWLVLLFHETVTGPAGEYQYNIDQFTQIVDAIKTSSIRVVTFADVFGQSSPPPPPTPPPGGEVTSITDWRSSDVNFVSVNNNGSGSVRIIGGTALHEAVSGFVSVNSASQYVLRINQTVNDRTRGGWAVWVDEFDGRGKYISGQWLGGNYKNFSGMRSYSYKPTSSRVVKVSFLLLVEKNSRLVLNANSAQLVR